MLVNSVYPGSFRLGDGTDNRRRRSSSSFHALVALSVFQLCDALHGGLWDILPLWGCIRGLAALEGFIGQF